MCCQPPLAVPAPCFTFLGQSGVVAKHVSGCILGCHFSGVNDFHFPLEGKEKGKFCCLPLGQLMHNLSKLSEPHLQGIIQRKVRDQLQLFLCKVFALQEQKSLWMPCLCAGSAVSHQLLLCISFDIDLMPIF